MPTPDLSALTNDLANAHQANLRHTRDAERIAAYEAWAASESNNWTYKEIRAWIDKHYPVLHPKE